MSRRSGRTRPIDPRPNAAAFEYGDMPRRLRIGRRVGRGEFDSVAGVRLFRHLMTILAVVMVAAAALAVALVVVTG
jgi:hypothetical protein